MKLTKDLGLGEQLTAAFQARTPFPISVIGKSGRFARAGFEDDLEP